MDYHFDTVIDRHHTHSMKWDVDVDELPMWVADMDFETAPKVQEAIQKRAQHGIYGYEIVPEGWYDAYIQWYDRRHHFPIQKEWMMFTTGVIPALSSMVRKLTTPAEKVVVQTPVYMGFFTSIYNNGREIVENPLRYQDGEYEIDFIDLEEKLKDPQVALMILCNPQNPSGKIWNKKDLIRVGELCNRYHVTVISDEIHCDLTDPGLEYTPFATASDICREISIICLSPTKAFNLAGIQTAAVVVWDEYLRHKVWRGLNTDEVAEPNVFAMDTVIAAYNESEEWLDALRQYLYENKQIFYRYVREHLPMVQVVESEATYLLWLDMNQYQISSEDIAHQIRRETGLFISQGSLYKGNGDKFIRVNIACPRTVMMDGLNRLSQGLKTVERTDQC